MKIRINKQVAFTIFCFLNLSLVSHSYSQTPTDDSLQYRQVIKYAVNSYYNAISINSPLYNGYDNQLYSRSIKGSAYYRDSLYFEKGSVNYEGIDYDDVPLVYDIYKDILISHLLNSDLKYSLVTEHVSNFTIGTHNFIRIVSDGGNIKTGFYEEPYSKKLSVLVKRIKTIQNSTDADKEQFFDNSISYFLKKDNTYYRVSSESDMLKVLKDKKQELNQYIANNKIKFRQDPIKAMVMIASWYDNLTN